MITTNLYFKFIKQLTPAPLGLIFQHMIITINSG